MKGNGFMRLLNGMKPSEYLETHQGRVRYRAVLYDTILCAYMYSGIVFRICLLKNGSISQFMNKKHQDWKLPETLIEVLAEYTQDKNLVTEYIEKNFDTPKEVADYLLQFSDDETKNLWDKISQESGKAKDRLGVYRWFEQNSQACAKAKGSLILKEINIDYDRIISATIEELKEKGK